MEINISFISIFIIFDYIYALISLFFFLLLHIMTIAFFCWKCPFIMIHSFLIFLHLKIRSSILSVNRDMLYLLPNYRKFSFLFLYFFKKWIKLIQWTMLERLSFYTWMIHWPFQWIISTTSLFVSFSLLFLVDFFLVTDHNHSIQIGLLFISIPTW